MLKWLSVLAALAWLGPGPAFADTIEGVLVSIDAEARTITLSSGEILPLTEYVTLDGLAIGQTVRVTCADDTIDVTAVDIIANSDTNLQTDNTAETVAQ